MNFIFYVFCLYIFLRCRFKLTHNILLYATSCVKPVFEAALRNRLTLYWNYT